MTHLPLTAHTQFPAHLKLHKGTVADICEAGGGERWGGGRREVGRGEERGGGREWETGWGGGGMYIHMHCVG